VKNIWDNDKLYPINITGNFDGADGTPSIENRTWWLNIAYKF